MLDESSTDLPVGGLVCGPVRVLSTHSSSFQKIFQNPFEITENFKIILTTSWPAFGDDLVSVLHEQHRSPMT
jgi:hypothetical protein